MGLMVTMSRFTSGGIGGRMMGNPVLLLTTSGRKSGKAQTNPLSYFKADGDTFVVASNGGAPRHPAWYVNLLANPTVAIQRGKQVQKAAATLADPERRVRLWQHVVAKAPTTGATKRAVRERFPSCCNGPLDERVVARAAALAASHSRYLDHFVMSCSSA
jgi:deazaflavin-dependent oxidoreductase (nitroreductase family)